MLGEAALTARRRRALLRGLPRRHRRRRQTAPARIRMPLAAPSISVKLSALHPRYELAQRARVLAELTPRLRRRWRGGARRRASRSPSTPRRPTGSSCRSSCSRPRARDPALAGWDGFGLAVQAYQKRALGGDRLARRRSRARRGAAHHRAAGQGRLLGQRDQARAGARPAGYPVFTRKPNTDVSYLACARLLLDARRRALSAVRHPQRAHRRRDLAPRATAAARRSSSSACTAWARSCTRR